MAAKCALQKALRAAASIISAQPQHQKSADCQCRQTVPVGACGRWAPFLQGVLLKYSFVSESPYHILLVSLYRPICTSPTAREYSRQRKDNSIPIHATSTKEYSQVKTQIQIQPLHYLKSPSCSSLKTPLLRHHTHALRQHTARQKARIPTPHLCGAS